MRSLLIKLYTIFFITSILLIPNASYAIGKQIDIDKDIKRVQQYFNNLHSIESEFIQTDSQGGTREGKFYLSRPNKMRLDYETLPKELIMLSEDMFIHYDYELKEMSYISAEKFPITFLSKKNIDLKKDAKVLNVTQIGNILDVEIELKSKDEYKPRVTLEFEKSPFNLKTIIVQDPEGGAVTLELRNAKYNSEINKKTFVFKNPNFFN